MNNIYITWISEIRNVWANDANKVAVIVGILFIPVLFYLFFHIYFKMFSKRLEQIEMKKIPVLLRIFLIDIIFIFILISYFAGLAGIGQVVVIPFIDAFARSVGIVLFTCGLFLLSLLYTQMAAPDAFEFDYKSNKLYRLVRHPSYSFLLMIALGATLLTMSLLGLILSFFVLLPIILVKITNIEKGDFYNTVEYIDYKSETPLLFPDLLKKVRIFLIHKMEKKRR